MVIKMFEGLPPREYVFNVSDPNSALRQHADKLGVSPWVLLQEYIIKIEMELNPDLRISYVGRLGEEGLSGHPDGIVKLLEAAQLPNDFSPEN